MVTYFRDTDPIVGRAATAKRKLKRLDEMYGQQVPTFIRIERSVLTREAELPEIPQGEPITPTVNVREHSVLFGNRRGDVGSQNEVIETRRPGSRAPPSERGMTADDVQEMGNRSIQEQDVELNERGRNMFRETHRRSEPPPERDNFDYPEAPEEY